MSETAARPPARKNRTMHRLAGVMVARLVLSMGIFAIALALEGVGRKGPSAAAENGLYTSLALVFLATAVYGLVYGRIRRPERFGAVQVASDVALVTALVYFTGGGDSIFGFLYVLIAVYGAMLFHTRGAFGAATLGAAAYGSVLVTVSHGWLPYHGTGPVAPGPVLLAQWGVNAGALMLVALLSSVLSRELQRADQALAASASDLRRLTSLHERTVESLMSGLLTTDLGGSITSFNQEAERMTGFALAEARGQDIDEVLPGVHELLLDRVRVKTWAKPRERMRYRTRDGRDMHLGLAGSILREQDGSPSGYVVIFQDVTRVVEMEDELRRSERLAAVGQLAADIAHEVRNPLASISGSIQILEKSLACGDEEGDRLMGIVLRETDRLNTLITDFLHYARPQPAKPEAVLLESAVAEVMEMLTNAEPVGTDPPVEVDVPPGLAAYVDPDQLRQVLWNLCLNGLQALGEEGGLRLSAYTVVQESPQGEDATSRNRDVKQGSPAQPPEDVEIRVEDDGSGIAPDILDRIFDPFFTTKAEGTGLGLAMVHRIVEENHGVLRVESAEGRGTTVRIRLPQGSA